MKFILLISLFACFAALHAFRSEAGVRYSASYNVTTQKWRIDQGLHSGWIAWGTHQEHGKEKGWNVLDLVSNFKSDDSQQAYAAGFLEGALTHPSIWNAWNTFYNGTLNFQITPKLLQFAVNNDKWVRKMASASYTNEDDAEYWKQVGFVLAQFDGLFAGYNQYAPQDKQITYNDFLIYEIQNDMSDIQAAVQEKKPSFDPISVMLNTHCSSLVKISPDGMNLFSSHVTWTTFSSMLRTYKHYDLPFNTKSRKSSKVSFSSAPGTLESGDDWYITNKNLIIMETTNSVMNMSLYQFVTEQTVLYWIRNIVANRMSETGEEWVNNFSKYNSGTYNNQWMVIDNKLFTPGQPLVPGTLWVAEQIPGYVISADKTDTLKSTGYWASYNIPYFPFVYNISGYPAAEKQYGNSYSYTKCPRAQIFTRDHSTVTNMESMKRMMRYNKWQTDPLSLGNSCNSISARCDLNPPNLQPFPFGAIDCKISDNLLSKSMESLAVSAPTWDSQPVFAWTQEWIGTPHYGQADVFSFGFENMKPEYH